MEAMLDDAARKVGAEGTEARPPREGDRLAPREPGEGRVGRRRRRRGGRRRRSRGAGGARAPRRAASTPRPRDRSGARARNPGLSSRGWSAGSSRAFAGAVVSADVRSLYRHPARAFLCDGCRFDVPHRLHHRQPLGARSSSGTTCGVEIEAPCKAAPVGASGCAGNPTEEFARVAGSPRTQATRSGCKAVIVDDPDAGRSGAVHPGWDVPLQRGRRGRRGCAAVDLRRSERVVTRWGRTGASRKSAEAGVE